MNDRFYSIIAQRRKELGQAKRMVRNRVLRLQAERCILQGQNAGLSIGVAALRVRAAFSRDISGYLLPVIRTDTLDAMPMATITAIEDIFAPACRAAG